ncbi:hypothetical protein A6070_10800 [Syntrophotalea acetylenica]|nr:hypothetical protein A6070_10800 [Syntrophotalea acetylenica]
MNRRIAVATLTRATDRCDTYFGAKLLLKTGNQLVIIHAKILFSRQEFDRIFSEHDNVPIVISRLVFDDESLQAQAKKVLGKSTPGIGLLDGAGQGAFATNGKSTRARRRRICQKANAKYKFVFLPQGITFGVNLIIKNFGDECSPTKQLHPLGGALKTADLSAMLMRRNFFIYLLL